MGVWCYLILARLSPVSAGVEGLRAGQGSRSATNKRGKAPAVSPINEFEGIRSGKTNAFDSLCRGT